MRERRMVPKAAPQSYYDRPILKEPVWTWEVPLYLFTGGVAGGAAPLAAAARLSGNDALAWRASLLSLAGAGLSAPLLISDLGRPERFFRMLRVFKPTSAMSMGTWILTVFSGVHALSCGWQLIGIPGKRIGVPATVASAAIGPVVSTYTAVLVVQTSIPVWHEARRTLPFVFAGSSLAAAGGAAAALTGGDAAAPARALAIGGAALELSADVFMEHRLHPKVREAYAPRNVRAAHWTARAATVTGAALMTRRDRRSLVAGGLALCTGSVLERMAVIWAGRASARDPAQTVVPQRERMAAAT